MKPTLDYNIPWKEIVEYDTSSPTFLRWKSCMGRSRNVTPGAIAGSCIAGNYTRLGYKRVEYKVHRIIWVLYHGSIGNDDFIDHVDGNKSNNSIDNLRLVTIQINGQNMKKMSSNTSGVVGVTFQRNKCNNEYWVANWKCFETRKHMAKSFSLLKYGEDAFQLACEHRLEMIRQQNLLGANYTPRHISGAT